MKSDFICWCLLTSFIGVFADNRTVEEGSFVLLFENVTADNEEKEVSLFVNGDEDPTLVVTFKIVNGYITMAWKSDNYRKIFMDARRNIWIANVDETYERKYYIQSSKRREVELTILKTSYSTAMITALKENTQKGDALPDRFPQVSEIVHGLYPLIKNTLNEAVRTAVNMTVEQLKDVVVKPIVESNIEQLTRLEEMYKKILDEKQMSIDEKQKLINEKEVLLESMNTTIKNLESKMEKLEASFDDLEQNGLGSSIRLNNVKLGKDESCEEKVVDVITNMANVSISRDDIERCHPLGKPNKNGNRQLMIKFKSYKTKAKVFSQKKNMNGNDLGIFMIDDLTRPKPDLLNKLLKYKTSKHIAAFWIADGKIYATKYPGSYPKQINTMQDIEHLLVNAETSLFSKTE